MRTVQVLYIREAHVLEDDGFSTRDYVMEGSITYVGMYAAAHDTEGGRKGIFHRRKE